MAYGSFTLDSGEYGKLALTPDGEIVSAATTEEWREGLRYIKSLYDIGAIYDGTLHRMQSSFVQS
mgnify:CR=1 FL=1